MKHRLLFAAGQVAIAAALMLTLATFAAAQEEAHKWSANLGGGFTPLVGAIDKRLDNGWHITFGGGYRATSHFTIGAQAMYNGLGVNRNLLNEVGVPGGNAHLWAFTLEPRLNLASTYHHFSPYLIGGVGYYRRVVEFTKPTIASVTVFDPFFGFFPVFFPADQVIGRVTRNGIGGSGGIGFEAGMRHGTKFFVEARYHYASTGKLPTRMIPVTIGVRF